jgi:hypothetical protein
MTPLASTKGEIAPPLTLDSTIALPGVPGKFDHLALDPFGKRLFVTPEIYNSVIVVNVASGRIEHTIKGIGTPHAVLYRGDVNRIFVTDGDPGELKIFDGSGYQLVKKITLLAHTDSVKYDLQSKYLYIITGEKRPSKRTPRSALPIRPQGQSSAIFALKVRPWRRWRLISRRADST